MEELTKIVDDLEEIGCRLSILSDCVNGIHTCAFSENISDLASYYEQSKMYNWLVNYYSLTAGMLAEMQRTLDEQQEIIYKSASRISKLC